ncbi:hypothetical protein [Streptomyces sp. NPDC004538]|uniref:hypothetical protein n=1 Tax=Streptomyces sp. NPDC004538 TaxID=3154279 RepID=UPI0033A37841
MLSSLNLDRWMEATARLAGEYLADAMPVIATAAAGKPPVAVWDHREFSRVMIAEVPDAVPGLAEALRGSPPGTSRWIDPTSAPDWGVPEGFGEGGSMAITPLPGHGVPGGVLILLRWAHKDAFTEAEETLTRADRRPAGAATSAARLNAERDAITDILMRDLLPPKLRQVEGVDSAGGYRPLRPLHHGPARRAPAAHRRPLAPSRRVGQEHAGPEAWIHARTASSGFTRK